MPRSSLRRFAVLLALVPAAVAAGARPAAAADGGGERIATFASALDVRGDGTVAVSETIVYDFGGAERRGIFRFLPDRFPCEGAAVGPSCPEDQERRTPVTVVAVTRDGQAEPWERQHEGNAVVIRIGDPDRTLTGVHTYRLTYTVEGALNPAEGGGAVLTWNVTGNGWTVPIDAVTTAVTAPDGTSADLACAWGPIGAERACPSPGGATGLARGEGLTVRIGLPAGAVTVPEPILHQPQTLRRAFSVNAGAGGLALLTATAGAAVAVAVGRRGRDRRFVGGPVEVAMGRAGQPDEPKPLFEKLPEVMEYTPPDGVRPGQIGSLVDERVQHRDITATIVDLAVRRYVVITELDDDWRIARGAKAPDDALRPYERLLLDELFAGGRDQVEIGALKQKWHESYGRVRGAMYEDMVANGWYKSRPDASRRVGMAAAFALQFGGTGLTGGLAARTTVALGGLPLVAAGVATMAVARQSGARTALGSAMTARGKGFRRLIETPTQQEMARFAERNDLFLEYLPYAIAFGCASAWAKRFEALGVAPPSTAGWYVPLPRTGGGGGGGWDSIARSMAGFGAAAAATLAAAPAASGSASGGGGGVSSGGGFGGGGGGSW